GCIAMIVMYLYGLVRLWEAGAESDAAWRRQRIYCAVAVLSTAQTMLAGPRPPRPPPPPPHPPRRVVIIDDIVHSGRTARRTIRRVRRAGLVPLALACLIKYPSGRPIRLRACTIPIYPAYSLSDFGLRRSMFRPWRAESALRAGERRGRRRDLRRR
ncbi:hypothetical protein, partial [Nocardia brasiliensis]|uniref:hypothetical protein n=1 Tax=Nocardia brasiliensis TaxID=37326 RepID=UPI002456E149